MVGHFQSHPSKGRERKKKRKKNKGKERENTQSQDNSCTPKGRERGVVEQNGIAIAGCKQG